MQGFARKRKYRGIPDRCIESFNEILTGLQRTEQNQAEPKPKMPRFTFACEAPAVQIQTLSTATVLYIDGVIQIIITFNEASQRREAVIIDCGSNPKHIFNVWKNRGDAEFVILGKKSEDNQTEYVPDIKQPASSADLSLAFRLQIIKMIREDHLPKDVFINFVIFSHPHKDHNNHIVDLLEDRIVGAFIFHGCPKEYQEMNEGKFLSSLKDLITEDTKVFLSCINEDISYKFKEDPDEYFKGLDYYNIQDVGTKHSFVGPLPKVTSSTTINKGEKLLLSSYLTFGNITLTLLGFNHSVSLTETQFYYATENLDTQCLIVKVSVGPCHMIFPGDANIVSQEFSAKVTGETHILTSSRNSEFTESDANKTQGANSKTSFLGWKPHIILLAMSNNESLPSLNCLEAAIEVLTFLRRPHLAEHMITVFVPKEYFSETDVDKIKDPKIVYRLLVQPAEPPETYNEQDDPEYTVALKRSKKSDMKLRDITQKVEKKRCVFPTQDLMRKFHKLDCTLTDFDVTEGKMYPVFLSTKNPVMTGNSPIRLLFQQDEVKLLQAPYTEGKYPEAD